MKIPAMTDFPDPGQNVMYILHCADDSLYIGWTNDLKARVQAHNTGKGAKYTKNRCPVVLVYYEQYDTKQQAMSREYHVKKLTRKQKLALITGEDFQKKG